MEGIAMLTGKELGKAIADALALKGYGAKAALARYLGMKPPSVADMTKFGRIDKAKLPALWRFFSDVVGPSHWGLGQYPWIDQDHSLESVAPKNNLPDEVKMLLATITDAAKHGTLTPEQAAAFDALIKTTTSK